MKQRQIKDIAEIRSGYQFRGKVEASDDPNVAVIQIKDLGDRLNSQMGELVHIQLEDLTQVRLENPEPHFVRFGDVLFLSRGHRQVATVILELVTNTIATGYFFVLRPDLRKVRPAFLAWYINQPDFQEKLRPLSRGTHMPLVSKTDFQELAIVLPPLAVQDSILELQTLVERERELTASLLKKRGALAHTISQKLLSGRASVKDKQMPSGFNKQMMVPILSGDKMSEKRIGGVAIFRPRLESEQLARMEAEKHLRDGFATGTYTDAKKINEILQYQFSHFYKLMQSELPKSASWHIMEFFLGQYDLAAKIDLMRRKGELSSKDATYWAEWGPVIRRSFKHLAEVVTWLASSEAPKIDSANLPLNLDTVVICCEQLVELYILSDQTHGVHPNETTLTILPEGRLDYLDLKVTNFERFSGFGERISRDTERQKQYLGGKPLRYDLDFQAAVLDSAFQAEFGFGYKDAVQALMHLIDTAVVPDKDSFDVPFVRRQDIVDTLSSVRGWQKAHVDSLLAGFTLTQAKAGDRLLFKPKQEHRALRRGFFEMPHETGPHLVWSRCMARECLLELMKGTLFQRCPSEWKAPGINKALATLQNKAGDWFEVEVERNMASLGALGKASLNGGIGIGIERIAIPANIGEIDYLGYFPAEGLLTLLEDKMVDGGFEPSYFRDDLSSFITGNKPYADQLRRKVEWVRNNLTAVCKGLSSLLPGNPVINPTRVAGALVTLHPTYATYFISDYPCVPLTEVMDGYKAKQTWPYVVGVSQVP